mgnify:CR=1 FL=1
MAVMAERVSVDRRLKIPEEEEMSEREIIQPVMLVPMMAPMIMEMACLTFIIPEFTKPTTMTEVAEEDCITAVTPDPRRIPFKGVPDSLYRMTSSLFPATSLRPSPIRVIPKRNRETPPSSVKASARFKISSCYL